MAYLSSRNAFRKNFISWWLICLIIQTIIIYQYDCSFVQSFTDAFISNALLCACCLQLVNNMRYYLPRREKYWYVFIISAGLGGLCLLLSRWMLSGIFRADTVYVTFLKASVSIRFGFNFLSVGCIAMLSLLWFTQEEQSQIAQRRTETEKLTRDAELFKLRQQLQPHFLFNSLNSISALAGSQPEKARHMIQQLSDFLRGTLRKEEQQWIPLKEELHYLELYLDIEKVRFGHRLQTITNYDENIAGFSVPAMLLQPVVENAIKFGLYDTIDAVTITIDAHVSNRQLAITISNPFDPETTNTSIGTGFGLSSIQRRLFLLFARNDLLQTKAENNIFTTILIIPQVNDKSNTN